MANTTLQASVIAKEALVILENQLGVIDSFYRAPETEYAKKVNGYTIGDTLSIRRPADFTVRSGATMALQDVIEGYTQIVIDQQLGVDFQFTSTELTLKIPELSERVIRPAMSSLINSMLNDCYTQLYRGTYNWVGTPGTTLTTYAGFAKALQRMDELAVPQEDRWAGLTPADYWGFLGGQTALYMQDVAKSAFRAGEIGQVAGVPTMMSQVLPTHTVGPLGGSPTLNGANQNVTYDSAKNTWTQTLITTGWTSSSASRVKAGDVFTIAGVNSVNPKTKVSTGVLQQFVITADASDVAGAITLTISPPLITSGPYQTVNAVPTSTAVMTMLGTASTAYRQNLVYHKNAFALAVVPMTMPTAAYGGARESYKGMSLRVVPVYDGINDVSKWRLDLLYGRKLIDPRLSVRLSGT